MALLSSIHDGDCRNLSKKDELGVGKHLSGRVNFVLVERRYKDQRDKNDHAEYDVLGWNEIKHLAKVSLKFMKPRAQGPVSYSAPRIGL